MTRFDEQLIDLYRKASWLQRLHIIVRHWLCPFYEVERYVPLAGKILDLGCGYGIFTNFLSMKSPRRSVVGVDKDVKRIALAGSTLSGRKHIEFRVADLREYVLDGDTKCVVLMDLPLETSPDLLAKIYAALPAGGMLIIKSIGRQPAWKYYLTIFHMATVDKWLRGSFSKNAYFLKEEVFKSLLQDLGFEVKIFRIDRGYPCAHCLYVCNKN